MKKIILILLALIVVAGGIFFFLNSKDTYDKSKFNTTVTPQPLSVQSSIDFTLPDQFNKPHTISDDTKILILSFAKQSGHDIRNFLKTQGNDFLSKKNAFFIADVSPMPTVIRNAFALPDLKKSAYPVLLIYDESIAKQFKDETKASQIMIIWLDHKKVSKIQFVKDIPSLKKLI